MLIQIFLKRCLSGYLFRSLPPASPQPVLDWQVSPLLNCQHATCRPELRQPLGVLPNKGDIPLQGIPQSLLVINGRSLIPPHHHGLDILRAHNGTHSAPSRRPCIHTVYYPGGEPYTPLSRRADAGDPEIPAVFFSQPVMGL